jgi:hypothetical protein
MTAEQGNEQVRKQLWKSAGELAPRITGSLWNQIKCQTEYPARGQVEIQIWIDHPLLAGVRREAAEIVLGAKEDNDGQ